MAVGKAGPAASGWRDPGRTCAGTIRVRPFCTRSDRVHISSGYNDRVSGAQRVGPCAIDVLDRVGVRFFALTACGTDGNECCRCGDSAAVCVGTCAGNVDASAGRDQCESDRFHANRGGRLVDHGDSNPRPDHDRIGHPAHATGYAHDHRSCNRRRAGVDSAGWRQHDDSWRLRAVECGSHGFADDRVCGSAAGLLRDPCWAAGWIT